jgi:hypothetical protein
MFSTPANVCVSIAKKLRNCCGFWLFLTIMNVLKIKVPNNDRLQQLRAEKESKLQETERLKSQQKMDDLQLRRLTLRIQGTVAQILSV